MKNRPYGRLRIRCSSLALIALLIAAASTAHAAGSKETDYKKAEGQENWQYTYDISKLKPGKYNMIAEGTDTAGNTTIAGPYNVYVDPKSDLPVVSISSPTSGLRVGADLHIVGTCTDDDGVSGVEVKIDDGEYAKAEGREFWSYAPDLRRLSDGRHLATVRGTDVNGVTGEAASVAFNLDRNAPAVTVTSHRLGQIASGVVSLEGSAEDANGIASLEFSDDGGKTYRTVRFSHNREGTSANFAVRVDTRTLDDGPYLYWLRCSDATGSTGDTPFVLFVDNTAPRIDIITPAGEQRVGRTMAIAGKITEKIGIKSLSYDAGEGDTGSIELTPGDPYFLHQFDFNKTRGDSKRVRFTVVDLVGNLTRKEVDVRLLPAEADLPVVTLRSPTAGEAFADRVLVSGVVNDDDGIQAVVCQVDSDDPQTMQSDASFSFETPALTPGEHSLSIHGVDINGTAGPDVRVRATVTGPPPSITIDSARSGERSDRFRPGYETDRFAASILTGSVATQTKLKSLTYELGGAQTQNLSAKAATTAGRYTFEIPLPRTIPYGINLLSIQATDQFDRTATFKSFIHVRNDTRRHIDPGLYLTDERIGADGSVAIGEGWPLYAIVAGEEIRNVRLEPASEIVSASFDGDRITIRPVGSGTTPPTLLRVLTAQHGTLTSRALRFTTFGLPEEFVRVTTVRAGDSSSTFYPDMKLILDATLEGVARLPGKIATATYRFGEGKPQTLRLKPQDSSGETVGRYTLEVPVPRDLPFGKVSFELTASNTDGRTTRFASEFFRVDRDPGGLRDGPEIVFSDHRIDQANRITLAPGEELRGRFNGRPIREVRLAEPTPLLAVTHDGSFLSLRAVGEGVLDRVQLELTTEDGDVVRSAPYSVVCDASAPSLVVDTPKNGEWAGKEITLSGITSDPNGIARLEYSIGPSGGFIRVPLSTSTGRFELPVRLDALPDGDVALVVRSEDGVGRRTERRLRFMKDAEAPTVAMISPAPTDAVNGLITASWTVQDSGSTAHVEYSTDGQSYTTLPPAPVYRRPLDLSTAPESGRRFYIRATDQSGNQTVYSPTLNVQQATDVPTTQILLPAMDEVVRRDFTISGIALDDDGVGAIEYRIDGGEFKRLSGGTSFSIPVRLAELSDNEHSVEVRAEDLNGVKSAIQRSTFRVSKAAPTSRLVSPAIDTTSRKTVTLEGESQDKNGIKEVWLSFDNGKTYNRAEGTETWRYRLDTRILMDGTYTVFVKAIDGYDTPGLYSTLLSLDNTEPGIALDSPKDASTLTKRLLLDGRATDNIELTSLKATLAPLSAGSSPTRSIDLPLDGNFSHTVDIAGLAPGWYDLSVEGRDKADNIGKISRDLLVAPPEEVDRVDLLFPVSGEGVSGFFTLAGRVSTVEAVRDVSLLVDGTPSGTIPVNDNGYFATKVTPETLPSGPHTISVRAAFPDGRAVASEERSIRYTPTGPWIRIESHAPGDFLSHRPFLRGKAGYLEEAPTDGATDATRAARSTAKKPEVDHRIDRVEVSLDNGRSFFTARGGAQWQYRLETQNYPDGQIRVIARAVFHDGSMAYDESLFSVDDTPPQIVLSSPSEEGRFNSSISLKGTAHDPNGVKEVKVAIRQGDKASYEVPTFVQGLFVEAHSLGATVWDFGVGLTFFDDNVKLEAQVGSNPDPQGRFSGTFLGAELLANVARLPFSYFLGPDWDWLSASLVLGARFSYVADSGVSSQANPGRLILGAMIGQLEFPIVKVPSLPVFKTYSFITEYQLWFISSDVEADFVSKLALGVRVGVF